MESPSVLLSPPYRRRRDFLIGQPNEHFEVVNEQQLLEQRQKIGRVRIPMPSEKYPGKKTKGKNVWVRMSNK